jgi:hypothetical protein
VAILDGEDSKKVGEELWRANLPIDPLSSYSVVC